MPPMVEAKMMVRIIQQIMIMIFFCSSREEMEKYGRNVSIVHRAFQRKGDKWIQTRKRRRRSKECPKAREDGSGF